MIQALIPAVSGILDKFVEDKDQKAKLAHEISTMAERHAQELAKGQLAVNAEEAKHRSIFVAGWRPFIGWACGISLFTHTLKNILNFLMRAFSCVNQRLTVHRVTDGHVCAFDFSCEARGNRNACCIV